MGATKQSKEINKKSIIPIIKFLSIFVGIISIYYIIIAFIDNNIFQTYLDITAYLGSFILNIFGEATNANNGVISSANVSMVLAFGCEGTEPIIILIAGIVAVPLSFIKKIIPGLLSIFLLYFLNLLRIVALYYIQKNYSNLFDTYHTIYFPIIFILISLLLMAWSIRWASKR